MAGDLVVYSGLCSVKGCPAPNSPDWHMPWCGHGLQGHHHHVVKRSQGGKQGHMVFLCSGCHMRIDEGSWGNAVLEVPGVGKVYRIWGLHNETILERTLDKIAAHSHGEPGTVPWPGGTGQALKESELVSVSAVSLTSPILPSERDGANQALCGEGLATTHVERGEGLATTHYGPVSSLVGPAPFSWEAGWCQRGMVLVHNGLRLKGLTDGWRWQVGDWMAEGEDTLGEPVYQYFIPFRQDSAMRQYLWVAQNVLPGNRTELSWSHHRTVAALPAQDQAEALARAKAQSLTSPQLRAILVPSVAHPEIVLKCPQCAYEGPSKEFKEAT